MSLDILSVSHTGTSQTSVPVNSHLVITFNKPIKESDYYPDAGLKFKLFKIPENTQVGLKAGIVTGTPQVVYIKPLIGLQENATYQLVIIGRSSGVNSTDNDFMGSNHITQFTTNADAPFQSVTIENGVVTTNEAPVPTPVTPSQPEPPNYVDRDNLATTEDTLSEFYYDDDVGGNINRLRIVSSTPRNRSIWNQNVERIRTRWDRNITLIETGEVSVRRYSLPFETGMGPELNIPIHNIQVTGNQIDVYINETGEVGNFPTTNKEYILSFPEGSVVDTQNTFVYNVDEDIRFTGQLWPMYATPDQVISRLAMFDNLLAESLDKYEIAKMIHQLSIYVSSEIQGQELTPDLLFWMAHYIICRIAYELAIGPLGIVKTMTNRTILGQSASFRVVNDKSGNNPLKECMVKAANELGIQSSSVAANITVKSAAAANYPGRDHQWSTGYATQVNKAMQNLDNIEAFILERDDA